MNLIESNAMPLQSPEVVEQIYALERKEREREQVFAEMEHSLHAGMYARTCRLPAGVFIIGVMIKIPTLLVVSGGCYVFADKWYTIDEYQVIQAQAGRKQMYATFRPTEITMIFPSSAKTVEEAESEFTDEAQNLQTRRACQG